MKTTHIFATAAVVTVFAMTAPAQAQILGGGVRGGTANAVAGSFGGFRGMDSTNGRLSAGTDTSLYGKNYARRATDTAARVRTGASDTTTAAVREGHETDQDAGHIAVPTAASEIHETTQLADSATAVSATTAPVAGTSGIAVAGARGDAPPPSRPSNSAQRSARAPARSSSSGTQNAEKPRPVATQADVSASASADSSAGASTAQ